jgi:hypothetical protein
MKREKKKVLTEFKMDVEKAIKFNCFDCVGGQKKTDCQIEKCSLYQFRPWAGK